MAERRVLFLAVGATRRRAAVDEAARVVADGGTATIVVSDAAVWRNDRLAPGVRMVDLARLEARYSWMPVEQVLLVRAPRAAFRLLGRGPLRSWSQRAAGAYQRRVADPVHRRALSVLRRRGHRLTAALIRRHVAPPGGVDLIVVNDPASMPAAAALLEGYDRGGTPQVAYGLDYAVPAASQPAPQRDSGQPPQGDR